MKKRHYHGNSRGEYRDDEEEFCPRCEVQESDRDQEEAGFNCSHCGKRIKPMEEYYCNILSRETFEYDKGDPVVTPLNAKQVSTWCKDCYKGIFDL